jgi:hypothetical protein
MPDCRLLWAFRAMFALAAAPALAGNATLPENGRIEIVTWVAGLEQYRFTHDCTLSGKSVRCTGTGQWPQTVTKVVLDGTVDSGVLDMKYDATTNYNDPACSSTYVIASRQKLTLLEDGTGTGSWAGGTGTWVAASAKCAVLIGRKDEHAPEEANVRVTWRVVEGATQQAGFGDAQIKSALWKQLGQAEGPLARKCFDESFAKLNEARNAEMKERIEAAAYQQHVVETFAAAADVDDFDPQWMESAKSIGGSGDMKQRITDRLVKLLPGPFGQLIALSQKAYRLASGTNEKAVLPKLKGALYDAYKIERARRPKDPPAEVLKDASTAVGSWEKTKTDLIRQFPGANDDARERAMADYIAARFDFIYRARETAANKEKELAAAWAGASNDVARFRMSVLDCMAK